MFVIAYFTIGTPYAGLADALRVNLDSRKIPHDIRGVPNQGDWQKNTQYKSRFVRDMIAAHAGRPLVYLDVDCEVVADPILLDNLDCDIAATRFKTHELLSGTVYFGPGAKTLEVVEHWIRLCAQYPERFPAGVMPQYPNGDLAWDQRLLDLAIRQTGPRFTELPPAYTFIHDLTRDHYPGVEPIILHKSASREFGRAIYAA